MIMNENKWCHAFECVPFCLVFLFGSLKCINYTLSFFLPIASKSASQELVSDYHQSFAINFNYISNFIIHHNFICSCRKQPCVTITRMWTACGCR